MIREALKALLLGRQEKPYDNALGLLVQDSPTSRTWMVPFGLSMRCWPASPDSPVLLVQTREGAQAPWHHASAERVRDGIPVEPPFDKDGRCWALCPSTWTNIEDGAVLYVFSCKASAEAARDSAPRWLQQQLDVRPVVTYTPWRAPRTGHPVRGV